MAGGVLSSDWGSLSKFLLAEIFPVDARGNAEPGGIVVVAPPVEATIEVTANWQSPFENMGPESKAPALMAMIQTGMLSQTFMSLTGAASALINGVAESLGIENPGRALNAAADRLDQQFAELTDKVQGLSGATKLNSTQVYTGSAPLKLPMTLAFRAFRDARAEVEAPIDQLVQWSLPIELSVEGSISGALRGIANALTGDGSWQAVFPSRAPRYVGLRWGGRLFSPLVVESVSYPFAGPRSPDGAMLSTQVQLTLASVTALDQNDWRRSAAGQPIRLSQRS